MMLLQRGLKIAQKSVFSVPLKITVENSFPKVTRNIHGDHGHIQNGSTSWKQTGLCSIQWCCLLPITRLGWVDELVLPAAHSTLLLTITLHIARNATGKYLDEPFVFQLLLNRKWVTPKSHLVLSLNIRFPPWVIAVSNAGSRCNYSGHHMEYMKAGSWHLHTNKFLLVDLDCFIWYGLQCSRFQVPDSNRKIPRVGVKLTMTS